MFAYSTLNSNSTTSMGLQVWDIVCKDLFGVFEYQGILRYDTFCCGLLYIELSEMSNKSHEMDG